MIEIIAALGSPLIYRPAGAFDVILLPPKVECKGCGAGVHRTYRCDYCHRTAD